MALYAEALIGVGRWAPPRRGSRFWLGAPWALAIGAVIAAAALAAAPQAGGLRLPEQDFERGRRRQRRHEPASART
jgi:hypothetical protein